MVKCCVEKIVAWLRQPFHLLDTVRSRWQLVIFCGVFGCVFLTVFKPFNMSTWFPEAETPLFVIITFFSATGMAALALSQFAFRALFKIELTTRISFLLWTLFEFFIISIAAHFINFIFTHHPLFDFNEYLETITYTFLVLVLPYFLMILFLYLQQQLVVVEELTLKVAQPMANENISISDENDKVVLSLAAKNILYFKSEDNYVLLFYQIENKI
ncbi:MAG TPA: hypothetical protein DGG95_15210, partial [Cytophagales bacterium]|nr:hypothetical protein [Cytophagales bacterium]